MNIYKKLFSRSIATKTIFVLAIFISSLYILFGYFLLQPDIDMVENIKNNYKESNYIAYESLKKSKKEYYLNKANNTTEMLAKNSSVFLLNFDKKGMKDTITFSIKNRATIGIIIYDDIDGTEFISVYKDDGKLVFDKPLPKKFSSYLKIEKDIIYENKIGKVVLYCGEKIYKKEIKQLEEDTIKRIEDFNHHLDDEFLKSLIQKLFLTIIFFLTLFIVIGFLLNKFVNEPLNTLKDGLDRFFIFLQNKSNVTLYIDIKTDDEIGQMAKAINENIEISAKLHNEINELNYNLEEKVKQRAEQISILNQRMSESINVALVIQSSLLPKNESFDKAFKEYFIYWQPKDIVSGDIYLARKLSDSECFIMIVDCVGHGVSGAFISMLVKAIEKDFMIYRNSGELDMNNQYGLLSPAKVLQLFNQRLKAILNQKCLDDKTIGHDFGFDGGVLYINHDLKLGVYSGARTPMYVYQQDKVKVLSPDKVSIGYKNSDVEFEFNEYLLDLSTEQTLYLTTDGYLDQLGGPKGYPFGKKKFMNIIENNQDKSLKEQKEIFINTINGYQMDNEQTDDRTVIALKFG
jgi:serine phosphatase RsbU (regulator of sigma subunit)